MCACVCIYKYVWWTERVHYQKYWQGACECSLCVRIVYAVSVPLCYFLLSSHSICLYLIVFVANSVKWFFLFCFTDSAGPLMFQMINFCTKHPINLFFKPAFFISSCPGLSSLCFVSVLKGIAPRFYSSYLSRVTAQCLSDQNSLLSFT